MELCKNDVIETYIEKLGANGEGVARVGGMAVFIKDALPGERVRAKMTLVKKNFGAARLEDLLEKSPARRQPFCSYFGRCGGCALQHMSYDVQLEFKTQTVRETLEKVGDIEAEVESCTAGPRCRYRNKLSLPIRDEGGALKIGFFAAGTHSIVDINSCPLQTQKLDKLIALFGDFMRKGGITAYNEINGRGEVRHLVARLLDSHLTVTAVLNEDVDLKGLDALLSREYGDYALYKNFNRRRDNVILGEKYELAGGVPREVDFDGVKAVVHPGGFFQVNDEVREKLYAELTEDLRGADMVVDAYSGAGLLTLRLASVCARAVGIEINADAHRSALSLKERNEVFNVDFVCGDCGRELKRYVGSGVRAVVDPPRGGCSLAAIEALKQVGSVDYVSCNPRTLARDLKLLGKKIVSIKPFDMFAQTTAVETLVALREI